MNRHFSISLLLGLSVLGLLSGCGGRYRDPKADAARDPDKLLANTLATLKEATPTVAIYDTVVQQLNNYLALKQENREQMNFAGPDRSLVEQQLLGLLSASDREGRMKELGRSSFTRVDAYHLDSCFLFRDSARSLRSDLGPVPERTDARYPDYQLRAVQRAFDWVVRQVALKAAPSGLEPWPAHEVLRRGTGSLEERARVFLALLEQLEVDGCMIARTEEVKNEQGQTEARQRSWIPAALIGKELYLFDTASGLPISGSGGKGVATLGQARADASVLDKSGSEVKAAQLAKPTILVYSSLPALSPRMRYLQELLAADNRVILFENLPAVLRRFQEAGLGVETKLWTNKDAYPAILLARYVENPINQPRLQDTIVPRQQLVPPMFQQFARASKEREEKLYRRFDNLFLRLRIEPGSPRDLLVRGQPEQAIDKLLFQETRLDYALDSSRKTGDPTNDIIRWMKEVDAAERDLVAAVARRPAVREGQTAPPNEEETRLRLRIEGLWKQQEISLIHLVNEWAAPQLREHMLYLMGLAKMEQAAFAERLPTGIPARREAGAGAEALTMDQRWESAATWLLRFRAMAEEGRRILLRRSVWLNAVEFHLARCRTAQKRYAEAAGHLERVEVDDAEAKTPEGRMLLLARDQLIRDLKAKSATALR